MAVELRQTEERVCAEGEGLSLQESLVGLSAFGLIDITDDGIGVADQFVIVEPGVIQIDTALVQVLVRVPEGSPTGLVALLGIVSGKCAVPVENRTLTVHTLRAKILVGHGLTDTVDGHLSIFSRAQDG